VPLIEALEEGRGLSLPGTLLGAVLVEPVDAMVVEDSFGRHEVFVEVARLGVLPLCVVKQLVADVHLEIDAVEIGQVCVCSEVISKVDLGLFGRGSVLAG